jgi:hypothetical protein
MAYESSFGAVSLTMCHTRTALQSRSGLVEIPSGQRLVLRYKPAASLFLFKVNIACMSSKFPQARDRFRLSP